MLYIYKYGSYHCCTALKSAKQRFKKGEKTEQSKQRLHSMISNSHVNI